MHAGTIEWNGLDFSRVGKPKLMIRRQADPPAPAAATRQLVTLTVAVDIEALDPGTVQARLRHLQQSMQVTEGILRSATGSGHGVSWLAVPTGDRHLQELLVLRRQGQLFLTEHGEGCRFVPLIGEFGWKD